MLKKHYFSVQVLNHQEKKSQLCKSNPRHNGCNNNGKRQGGISFARMNHLIILHPRVFKYMLCTSITIYTALNFICSIYEVMANLLLEKN